jgi:hypothetical protein
MCIFSIYTLLLLFHCYSILTTTNLQTSISWKQFKFPQMFFQNTSKSNKPTLSQKPDHRFGLWHLPNYSPATAAVVEDWDEPGAIKINSTHNLTSCQDLRLTNSEVKPSSQAISAMLAELTPCQSLSLERIRQHTDIMLFAFLGALAEDATKSMFKMTFWAQWQSTLAGDKYRNFVRHKARRQCNLVWADYLL